MLIHEKPSKVFNWTCKDCQQNVFLWILMAIFLGFRSEASCESQRSYGCELAIPLPAILHVGELTALWSVASTLRLCFCRLSCFFFLFCTITISKPKPNTTFMWWSGIVQQHQYPRGKYTLHFPCLNLLPFIHAEWEGYCRSLYCNYWMQCWNSCYCKDCRLRNTLLCSFNILLFAITTNCSWYIYIYIYIYMCYILSDLFYWSTLLHKNYFQRKY